MEYIVEAESEDMVQNNRDEEGGIAIVDELIYNAKKRCNNEPPTVVHNHSGLVIEK